MGTAPTSGVSLLLAGRPLASGAMLAAGVVGAMLLAGCPSADSAKRELQATHRGELNVLLDECRERHLTGVERAAERLARGFTLALDSRSEELRIAMRRIQDPTRPDSKVVRELTASPKSLMVAIDATGVVLTRDVRDPTNDSFRGENWSDRFSVVKRALDEKRPLAGPELFEPKQDGQNTVWLFVAPAVHQGELVGAIALGIPLQNLAQFLTRQLQLNHASEKRLELWVYGYDDGRLAHAGTPLLVDRLVPGARVRAEGLAATPGGFVGEASLNGRPFGFLVMPVPSLGPKVGFVLLRADPQ